MAPSYRRAEPADAPALEALLAATDLPGWIALSYRADLTRAPQLHPAAQAQTLLAEAPGGALAGMATRLVLPGYWQGAEARIGWLGQMRLAPGFRHRPRLLRGGFAAFRSLLHQPGETPWYLASILRDNATAARLLSAGLPGFPRLAPVIDYRTLAFRARPTAPPRGALTITPARAEDAPALIAFLTAQNRTRPLAPVLEADETFAPGRWPGLRLSDFLIAREGGVIVGATALWAQAPYRALVVRRYDPRLAALRGPLNLAAPLTGLPRLPPPGQALAMAYLAFFTVAEHAPATARALLAAARAEAAKRGLAFVSLGLCADDPLLPGLAAVRHRGYDAQICTLTWEADEIAPPRAVFALAKVEISLL